MSLSLVGSVVSDDHVFENPAKLIKTVEDMKIWDKSEAYYEYVGFILAINDAVKGKSNSKGGENCSDAVVKVCTLLDKLDMKIDETPPVQQPQRFGNIAFRTWYQKMRDDSLILLQEVLPVHLFRAIPEIVSYLVEGFGNSTRIDYGTGHEISFVMFLCCLFKIGLLSDKDKAATGCKIFPKYLDVARKLQQTYRMEPAGSHGVWSLDDYQFVPFIWGSSQLFAHPVIEPARFLEPNILNHYGDDYMFLTCIRYINEVKTGPFAEHSNQLWSISGVASWSKINGGLIKMYKAEVLSKFPVIQHIVFGSLFTLKAVEQCAGLMSAKTSMTAPPVPLLKDHSKTVHKESSDRSLKKSDEGSGGSRSYASESSMKTADKTASMTTMTSAGSIKKQFSQQSTESLSASIPTVGTKPSETSLGSMTTMASTPSGPKIPSGSIVMESTEKLSSKGSLHNVEDTKSQGSFKKPAEVGSAEKVSTIDEKDSSRTSLQSGQKDAFKTPSQSETQGSHSDIKPNDENEPIEGVPTEMERPPSKTSVDANGP